MEECIVGCVVEDVEVTSHATRAERLSIHERVMGCVEFPLGHRVLLGVPVHSPVPSSVGGVIALSSNNMLPILRLAHGGLQWGLEPRLLHVSIFWTILRDWCLFRLLPAIELFSGSTVAIRFDCV